MIQAMRPKGLAVVISVKVETGAEAEGGGKVVGLEDKLKYQSKGKIQKLSEVLEYAGRFFWVLLVSLFVFAPGLDEERPPLC